MNLNVKRQIAQLRKMPAAQLREKHQEVFGEPSRSGHREYLFRRIAWKLQALAEGDLPERARRIQGRAAELARNADLRTTAPRVVAEATPGPDRAIRSGSLPVAADERLPMPGAVLTRKFKGRTYQVTVLPAGFEMDGQVYKSLTAVAYAITGSHWNGYLFFGLVPPRKGLVQA